MTDYTLALLIIILILLVVVLIVLVITSNKHVLRSHIEIATKEEFKRNERWGIKKGREVQLHPACS